MKKDEETENEENKSTKLRKSLSKSEGISRYEKELQPLSSQSSNIFINTEIPSIPALEKSFFHFFSYSFYKLNIFLIKKEKIY